MHQPEAAAVMHERGAGVKLPLSAPDTSLKPASGKQIEIYLDGMSSGPAQWRQARTGAARSTRKFRPAALYAAAQGTVRFKDVAYTI